MLRTHIILIVLAILVPACTAQAQRRDRYTTQRLYMVEEHVKKEGVKNERVLEAMRTVPRHEFMLPATRKQAYFDVALPIGHKQTISPPFIVAYMTEMIDPQQEDRILEIGTGSGYQAAVLSGLVKEVYSIEIVEPLGKTAAKRLARLGYKNVTTKVADGYKGWSEHAPFDKIIVTCSPEDVPEPLIEQLRDGGKMIVPLGERYQQVFYLYEKKDGRLVKQKLMPTLFVPMTGISEEARKIKPDPLNPRIVNGGFETSTDGQPNGFHYRRGTKLVSENAPEGGSYLEFENRELGRSAHILQGLSIDGRTIHRVRVSLRVKLDDVSPHRLTHMQPAFVIHYYDSIRRPLGEGVAGPFLVDSQWRTVSKTIRVPSKAREAIVRVGLNGSTGTLGVDGLRLTPLRK
ncbi:MAG: protein-L-isoaspartate O-methyltransferase [Planctomycetaceae bacterium]|nr:protein-L-isoaspartate O-methyltransferase [Planctomycetaceae bacterium]